LLSHFIFSFSKAWLFDCGVTFWADIGSIMQHPLLFNLQRGLHFILIHSCCILRYAQVVGHPLICRILSWILIIVSLIVIGHWIILVELRLVPVLFTVQSRFNKVMALPTNSLIVFYSFIRLLVHLLRAIHIRLVPSFVNLTIHWLEVILHHLLVILTTYRAGCILIFTYVNVLFLPLRLLLFKHVLLGRLLLLVK